MSEITPEDLSAKLDKVLPPGTQARSKSLVSASDPLIRAALDVADSPRPKPSEAAKARMAAKMFAALDAMPAPVPQVVPKPTRRLNPFLTGVAASVAAVILIAGGMLAWVNRPAMPEMTPTSPAVAVSTLMPTAEIVLPTATDVPPTETVEAQPTATDIPPTEVIIVQPTATDIPPTEVIIVQPTATDIPPTEIIIVQPTTTDIPPTETVAAQPTATDIPPTEVIVVQPTAIIPTPLPAQPTDVIPTSAPTLPSVQPTETPIPPQAQEAIFIIEGQVSEVLDDAVVIAGFKVQLTEKHPLLTALRAGDVIRIEGSFSTERNNSSALTFTLDPSNIALDNTDPELNVVELSPDGKEAWRDDGTCQNPPPAWANGNGWHKRCDNTNGGGNGNNGNGNNSGGNGNGNNGGGNNGNNGGGNGNGNGNGGGNGNGNGGGNSGGGNGNGNGNGGGNGGGKK